MAPFAPYLKATLLDPRFKLMLVLLPSDMGLNSQRLMDHTLTQLTGDWKTAAIELSPGMEQGEGAHSKISVPSYEARKGGS